MSQLASLLEHRADAVVSRWLEVVPAQLAANPAHGPALHDHGAALLRELTAALHGAERCSTRQGLAQRAVGSAEALVRCYGLLHRAILDLIEETKLPIAIAELRTLADFFSVATAELVAAQARPREPAPSTFQQERETLLALVEVARATAEAERRKLDILFTQAPVGVAIHEGPAHIYTFANPFYRALLGGRELVGKSLLEAVPELAGQGFDALFDRVMATGEPYVNEVAARVDRGSGVPEDGFYKVIFTAKRNAQGVVDGILQCAIEVTAEVRARKQLEQLTQQVRTSEAELRLVMDSIPLLVSFVGHDERYRTVNRAYEEWFGLSREQLVGKSVRELIGPTAYELLSPYVRRGLAGEHFSFEQHDVPYARGGARDVHVTFIPHRDEADVVDGYVALLEDVTERRRFEQEREALLEREKAAQARFFSALANQPMLYIALLRGDELRFEVANAGYRDIVGGRDVVGKTLHEALPELEGQGIDALLHGVLKTGQPFVGRELHVRLDRRGEGVTDAYFNFVYQAVTGPTGANEFVLVIGHDVTDDVLARQRWERQIKERADFEQQLIGIVSHDLRTPLNAILLGAASLLARRDGLDDTALKILSRVHSSAERMGRMIRDLLDFTQARLGGGILISPAPLDLHALARAAAEEVHANWPNRELRFEALGDGECTGDADRLAQVITNLVSNAFKYSAAHSPVSVRTRGERDAVVLDVHNLGAPIPAEAIEHMFRPMWRADAQVDKAGRSVGLGLYIVRHLVEAHGGTVSVESSADTGTVFTVTLPRG